MMRRKDKQVTEKTAIEDILKDAQVCHLGMTANNECYVVPLNFGYNGDSIFFHCAHVGKKVEMLRRNPRVCFEVTVDESLIDTGRPCDWGNKYRSVIGFGEVEFIEDDLQKRHALQFLVRHYSPKTSYEFNDQQVKNTTVFKVNIDSMTAKRSD